MRSLNDRILNGIFNAISVLAALFCTVGLVGIITGFLFYTF